MTTATDSQNKVPQSARKRAKRTLWPRIYTRQHRSGQTGYLVDLGDVKGKRIRRSFLTKATAEAFAEQARVARQNEGVGAFSLSQEARVFAAKCLEKLAPYNATLVEAVDYYVEHVLKYRNAPPVAEIVKQLLNDVAAAGRRERTIDDLRARLNRFALSFGSRQLSAITLPELQSWLADPALSARSRINYATKVSQLYNFAIRHGWADANLVERTSRPTAEDKEPGIFTVKHAAAVLGHAPEFGLLPYVAMGLFAGLRSAEVERLDWAAVKLGERAIIIGAEVAKKRSRRVVEISDALAAWIAPYVKASGPVVDRVNLCNRLNRLAVKAGVLWPANGLRHSFGTYHLAAFGDAVKTAAQMGHRDVGVLHNHYKALVTQAEAKHFWALRPKGEEGKIVPMPPDGEQGAAEATATEEASVKARQQSHS